MATEQIQDLPTIMLIQGSYQIPQVYDLLRQGLIAQGYTAVQPKLPSCSDTENSDFPQRSLTDDAAAIHDELSRLVNGGGKTVLVVMHSYGGLVGIEAITEDLVYTNRHARDLDGGVIHLFMYSAFVLDEGQSVLGVFGESPNNKITVASHKLPLHKGTRLTSYSSSLTDGRTF